MVSLKGQYEVNIHSLFGAITLKPCKMLIYVNINTDVRAQNRCTYTKRDAGRDEHGLQL